MPAAPAIPKILTNKDWQANKGKIAKLAGETGVGDQMKKVEAAYNKIDWTLFDAKQSQVVSAQPTLEDVEKGVKAAKAEFASKVEPLRKELVALRDLAKDVEASWKKNKLIPAASAKHAGEVAKEADRFFIELKSLDEHFKTFEEVRGEIANREKIARQMLSDWIKKVKVGCDAVAKNPTAEEYNCSLHQKVRGLGTAVGCIPELKVKWSPVWGNKGFASGLKGGEDESALKTRVDKIEKALALFEKDLK